MARIALITSEMAGRIQICCELGRRLQAAGHDVAIGSPAPVGERVATAGLRHLDMQAASVQIQDATSTPGAAGRLVRLAGRLAGITNIASRQDARAALLGVEEFTRAMEEFAPDLALIDLELNAHHLAARSLALRTAGWTSMLSVWKRPGLPPLGSDLMPEGSLASRLRIELAWLTFRARRWLADQRYRITRVGEDRISVLRRVAHRLNVPLDDVIDRGQWLVPGVPRDVPVLVFNSLDLDFPHRPLPSVQYVGPMLPPPTAPMSEELGKLFAERSAGSIDVLVYATFGAWDKGDDRAFVRRLLELARLRPAWAIVVGLGGRRDPAEFGAVPENVHLLAWAPQQEVLRHADAAIHHAGISSVNECIRAGVPMVVYPFEFLDQPGNAARVEYHGLGVRGDRASDTAADIARHVETVSDGPFRQRVDHLREALRRADEEDTAVAEVQRLLGSHQSPSAS